MNEKASLESPFEPAAGARVPASRYFDPVFFALEREKLWPRVWQLACRSDEIPAPGDFSEYRIASLSVLLVRQDDRSVKAFENACPHRATTLCTGRGSLAAGQIVCPFHGWRFGLDGQCSFIYGARGFNRRAGASSSIRLAEVCVAERFGHVWVNPDRDAGSFEDHLGQAEPLLASLELERSQANWWRDVRIGANWKIALEAFLEAYHVLQTHPELADGAIDDEYEASAYEYDLDADHGHGWIRDSPRSPMSERSPAKMLVLNNRILYTGVEGWCTSRQMEIMEDLWARVPDELDEERFISTYYDAVRADAAAQGAPLPERMGLPLAYVFPNIALINNFGNTMLYRFRPDPADPEACIWEIWSLRTTAEPAAERPTLEHLPDQSELPSVYTQDASNMERQQLGLHSPSFTAMQYSTQYEPLIPAMHRHLDETLRR